MISTRVTSLFGIDHPVILAGMASAPDVKLVAAVSNAGGLGILGAGYLSAEQLEEHVRQIRELTDRPFGVNFLLCFLQPGQLEAALDSNVPLISTSWGDPGLVVDRAHAKGAKVMHMVQTVEDARQAAQLGVDVIVAQGTEAGGHVGSIGTMPLIPQVVDAVGPIPVVAAGGIADGRGLVAALGLGAEGVLMGTRFLASVESIIHDAWKQAIVRARETDTIVTEISDIANGAIWPGARARAIRNAAIEQWLGREWELRRYGTSVGQAMARARLEGNADDAVLFAGQVSGMIDEVRPAAEIVQEIVGQAEEIISQRLSAMVGQTRVPSGA